MAGLEGDSVPGWEDAPIRPFNVWSLSEIVQVTETGVSTDVVLYLYSDQTHETIAVMLHPHTAASIGLDLLSGYVDH